jgi:hypothetical protein
MGNSGGVAVGGRHRESSALRRRDFEIGSGAVSKPFFVHPIGNASAIPQLS